MTEKTKMKLAPYQVKGVEFLASRKTALLADEMRLGKTAQVICAADKLNAKKVLVVCPASVKITWLREFAKWSTIGRTSQIVQGTKFRIDRNIDLTIINYDIIWRPEIKKQLLRMNFAVIAVDEAHYLAGRKSNRTQAMLSATDRTPILSRGIYRWFTTGTPVLNRPRDLYPLLAASAPEVIAPYNSYNAYTTQFCAGYWDGIQWVDKGASNMKELNERLHKNFMLRRLRRDVLAELPQVHHLVPMKANKKQQELLASEFNWDKDAAKYQKDLGNDEIATVRRELGVSKVPEALSYIKYILSMEEKLVVFAYHREVLDQLHKGINGSVMVRGGMSPAAKQESIDRFTNDRNCNVFLGQITAAGVGIDLSSANNILFVESSWVPGEIDQATDRCSGWNQDKAVSAQFMVIQDSLEEHMLRTVIDKKKRIHDIVEKSSLFD